MATKNEQKFDLVIIGSGPAGIHAAVQAAKFDKHVAIVEKTPGKLGGAWIHTGTIPSKTMRESLSAIQSVQFHVGKEWVTRIVDHLSAGKLLGRAHHVASQEEAHVRKFVQKNKIQLFEGYALIEEQGCVRVNQPDDTSFTLKAKNIMIATGSRPRRPADVPFDGWRVVDSDDVLHLPSLPKKLVIYGAGVIGCEYACIFAAQGVDVTIVDGRNRVMQYLDREITEELKTIMEDHGVKFVMGKKFESVRCDGPRVFPCFSGDEIECDLFFFAAGRVSNTENLGLEKLGVKFADRGAVAVNEHFHTNIPNIYAAGDAIGMPALAATSAEQGRYAACHMFGNITHEFPKIYPVGIYTIPEMSSVGKTEEELNEQGMKVGTDYVVGRAYMREVARGYIRGDNHGLLKILVCKQNHKILGIHVIGPDACNLIHIGLGFMLYEADVRDIINKMIFNYPTLAETYRIATFNALNKIYPHGDIYTGNNKKKAAA